MAVFAVIPTYNRKQVLAATLHALQQQTHGVVSIVADSGSTDGTAESIARDFPDAILKRSTSELWWTSATNLALREALSRASCGDFILLINDDVLVAPDYVEKLLVAAVAPKRIVGSAAVAQHAPGDIIDGGQRINWWTAAIVKRNIGRPLDEFPPGHLERVDVLPGRGTLIPLSAFHDLGLLPEEHLPHYMADYAYSARCARAGYDLVVCYDAVVRSRTELTGMHVPENRWTIADAYQYFFGRRSACNIQDRFHFAWIARSNALQAFVFFWCSVARLVYHYAAAQEADMAAIPTGRTLT